MNAVTIETKPILEVLELTKSFGGYIAVNHVSFSVARGEIRAVIGPNGAGKTTLFNLLSGYLKPTSGRVVLDGVEVGGRSPHRIARQGVSRAFQTTNIFPSFTVVENVLVSLFTHHHHQFQMWGRKDKKIMERAEAILELVHLQDAQSRPANTLAHGDQRALEIAIALSCEPKILFLDEPTAGMSPFETQAMIQLLEQIAKQQGLTVVLSEHDMEVVFGIAQQIIVMEAGRVLADGTPATVRTNPEVIRAYLGDAQ